MSPPSAVAALGVALVVTELAFGAEVGAVVGATTAAVVAFESMARM